MTKAKQKVSSKRLTIGYLTPWIHDPISRVLWAGIDDTAHQHDANLLCFPGGRLHSSRQPVGLHSAIYDLATEGNVDGLILRSDNLATDISPEEFEDFCRKYHSLPTVSIIRALEDIPSVQVSNEQGMHAAVTHLVEVHHLNRIAFIRGFEGSQEAEQRYRGYTRALVEHELSFDPDLVVPGSFTWVTGAEAINILLDQRKLKPGTDFDAIAASSDLMAFGAVEALQARGMQVPEDIAITGFDNIDEAKYGLPPLTTVQNPLYEVGRKAAELLLTRIEGRDAPERVLLPCELVVRQSCGCPLTLVTQAGAGSMIPPPTEKPIAPFSSQRENVLPALMQAMEISLKETNPEWAEGLLDAFIAEMEKGAGGAFLAALERVLSQSAASGLDIFLWQDAVSALRRYALPYLSHGDVTRAEDILGQARVLIGDTAQRIHGRQVALLAMQNRVLTDIEYTLLTKFDMAELLETTIQAMQIIGIPSCCILMFENAQASTAQTGLLLAYDDREKLVDLDPEGRPLPSSQLVPDSLLSLDRRRTLVLEPLHLQDHRLWFMLLEAEPAQGDICQALRAQLSSALQGVLLLRERAEAGEALEAAYAEVEKQVRERTAELRQEIAERERAEAALKESEAHYRAIVEDQTELICRFLPDGTITFVNEAFCRYFGRTPEELVGHELMSSASQERKQHCKEWFAALSPKTPTATHEHRVTMPDGEIRWQQWFDRAILDDQGQIIEFQSVGVDITKRKQIEAEREQLMSALERHAIQLQTAIDISHAASSILDPNELSQKVIDLVRESLGLYYAGLFLVDQTGEWAVLQAGTGEAGRHMVEQAYTLEIGGSSAIGQCIANKQAQIALAVGEDVVGLNKLLPETRSELALPLVSRGQAIGAVTIQSSHETAFSEDDVAVFQTMADQLANAIANARLYDQAQRELAERKRVEGAVKHRLEQLAALSQASQVVTASLKPNRVLAEIVSLANGVVESDFTSVILMDDRGNIGQSAENLPGVQALEYRIRDEGFTRWIVRARRALVVDEIDKDGAVHPNLGEGAPSKANPVLVEAGIKSLAGLPLMVKDRLLGVLYLHSLHPKAFGGQLFLLSAFANQVAIALENARLFQTEQQQTQRLALLVDVARIAATTLHADALLQAVADSISRHFNYPRVAIFTLDEGKRVLILRGRSSNTIATEKVAIPGAFRLSIEEGISGHVARSGKAYLCRDVSTDPYFVNPTEIPTKSALCVPILDGGQVAGTIIIESEQLAAFDKGDQSLLEAVADTAAIGLRNTRLYQEAQRRVQELTLLNSIAIGPGAILNPDAMIDNTLEGLHELITADRISFVTTDTNAGTWKMTHSWSVAGVESNVGVSGSLKDAQAESKALLDGQPFAVSDATNDPRIESSRELYLSLGTQSALAVPVRVGGRFYGALALSYCRERHLWQPDEIRLLKAVVHQLGLVLENAHLFEEIQLRADELAAALARLEEMDRLKDEFIQNVSHELRSPLALVRGYAEMLDAGELGEIPAAYQQPIAIIARRSRMLSDLVKDITLILEAEVSPPEPEPVSLDELTRNAVEDFQVAAEQAELTLRAEIAPDLPLVRGDSTYLRRVLDNLLGNAVKFTPPSGSITVRLWQGDEHVALEVSDTGIGIAADKLPRIFDRFYQVDGSASRRYGGMGLGLALVKEIVEAYGGHVLAESHVEKGSKFTVFLPIAADTGATDEDG
jgi:PAS domain S-box-containing protein